MLAHYDLLSADLAGEMGRLASRLGISVPTGKWPGLLRAASFQHMRSNAGSLAPDPSGIFRDRAAFFRRGSPGAGRELLTPAELRHYPARAAQLAPPDLLAWLHSPGRA